MATKRSLYYKKDGSLYGGKNPPVAWAKDFSKDNGEITSTNLWWGGLIKTFWRGIDFSFGTSSKPMIFGTTVLLPGDGVLETKLYATEWEAVRGHKELVKYWIFTYRAWRMFLVLNFCDVVKKAKLNLQKYLH